MEHSNNLLEKFANQYGIDNFDIPDGLGEADESILFDWNGNGRVINETE